MAEVKTSLKKRTLIAKSNKQMFIWVAVVSGILSISIVGSIIIAQNIIHMNKVIDYKSKTLSNIKYNNSVIPELQDNVRALNSNQALIDSKARPSDEAIQVILDALPSEANSLALGASFQKVLLTGIDGVRVESITVDPVAGVEAMTDDGTVQLSSEANASVISYRFSVSGPLLQLIEVLKRLEKSVRVIDTTKVKIESQGSSQVLTVEGVAYYQPAIELELTKEKI